MDATVQSHVHGSSSGAQTSLTVSASVAAAGQRVFAVVFAESASIAMTSVLRGGASGVRVQSAQLLNHKIEIWAWEVPVVGSQSVVVTSPSAVKLGCGVFTLDNAATLYGTGLRLNTNQAFPAATTAVSAQITGWGNTLGIALMVSDVSSQTIAVTGGTEVFTDTAIATTDLHLAAVKGTLAPVGEAGFTGGWTLGTADFWSAVAIAVRGIGGVSTAPVQVNSFAPFQSPSTTQTTYADLLGGMPAVSVVADTNVGIAPCAGTLSNIALLLSLAPGAGKSWTFTVYVNGSPTAAVLTISGATDVRATYTGSLVLAKGDAVYIELVPSGTPTAADFLGCAFDFTGAESLYVGSGNAFDTTTTGYCSSVFCPAGGSAWIATAAAAQCVAAAAGTISRYYIRFGTAGFGTTSSWDFLLYKNGVAQDGTGGTVDTRRSVNTGGTSVIVDEVICALPVVPGDVLYATATYTGSPATRRVTLAVAFTPTTVGQSQWCRNYETLTTTGAARYASLVMMHESGTGIVFDNTEANIARVNVALTPFLLSSLQLALSGAPGAGKSYTITVRKNSVDEDVAATVADTADDAADLVGQVDVVEGNALTISALPAGTPTARSLAVGLIQGPGGTCVPLISNISQSRLTAGATTLTWSHTAEVGKTIYVLAGSRSSNAAGITGATFGGVPMVLQDLKQRVGTSFRWMAVFSLTNPTAGAANIVVTHASAVGLAGGAFNVAHGPADGGLIVPASYIENNTTDLVKLSAWSDQGLVVAFAFCQTRSLVANDGTTMFAQAADTEVQMTACYATAIDDDMEFGFTRSGTGETAYYAFLIPSDCIPVSGGSYQVFMDRIETASYGAGDVNAYQLPSFFSVGHYVPWLANGTIRSLAVHVGAALGAGKTLTFELVRHGPSEAITDDYSYDMGVTLTLTGASQTSDSIDGLNIPLYKYGRYSWRVTNTSASTVTTPQLSMSMLFEHAAVGQSIYGGGSSEFTGMTLNTEYFRGPMNPGSVAWSTAVAHSSLIGCAGNIVELVAQYQTDIATVSTFELGYYLNGVKQDGSGGTIDTRVFLPPATRSVDVQAVARKMFVLPVVPGDMVRVYQKELVASTDLRMCVMTRFIATTPGEFMMCGCALDSMAATKYFPPTIVDGGGSATESTQAVQLPPLLSPLEILGMQVRLNTAPGATARSWTFSLRKNIAVATGTPSVPVVDPAVTGSASGTASYATDDLMAVIAVPSGSPASPGPAFWALRGFMDAPTPGTTRITQLAAVIVYDEDAEDDAPPTVNACTGGGSVAAGTDPAAGTSLATATTPLSWVEITPIGGSTLRYASVGIPHGTFKQGRVLSMGRVKRVLADGDHGYESAVITTMLADTDGVLRALGNTLKGALVDYFTADLATIKAAGTPWRRFRGILDEWAAETDLEFSITSVDLLTARLTSIDASDLQVPNVLIDGGISDQNPLERMFDKPVPEPYGAISDEDASEPEGVWEFKHVGFQTIAGDEDLGNVAVFLVGLGAVKKIQSVFGADLLSSDPPTVRIKLGASAFGDWRTDPDAYLLVPTMTGWPEAGQYSDRSGRRYTLIFGKDGHPAVVLAVENRIPFVGNFCARESVGDTSGTMFESGAWQLLHWLNNGAAQQATGNWLTLASFGDYSIFNRASFSAVHDICATLGYVFAGIVGGDFQQRSWRDPVADWCRSGGFDFGIDRHGRAMIEKLDVSDAAVGVPAFTPSNILEGSVNVDQRLDAVENTVRYLYAENYKGALPSPTPVEGARLFRDPYDGQWGSGLQVVSDSASITALGGDPKGIRRSAVQEYRMTRDPDTADAVAAERLALNAPAGGRPEVRFDVLLKDGCNLELGDIVTVEHWDLPWVGAPRCQVRGLEDYLDEMTRTVTVRYVNDVLI